VQQHWNNAHHYSSPPPPAFIPKNIIIALQEGTIDRSEISKTTMMIRGAQQPQQQQDPSEDSAALDIGMKRAVVVQADHESVLPLVTMCPNISKAVMMLGYERTTEQATLDSFTAISSAEATVASSHEGVADTLFLTTTDLNTMPKRRTPTTTIIGTLMTLSMTWYERWIDRIRFKSLTWARARERNWLISFNSWKSIRAMRARIQVMPEQPGDVPYTCADMNKAHNGSWDTSQPCRLKKASNVPWNGIKGHIHKLVLLKSSSIQAKTKKMTTIVTIAPQPRWYCRRPLFLLPTRR
jgi:hypothetical protein